MIKNLVIVESPAKAKTIEGYLGKDFTVKSSFGHIRDLEKGDKAIDVNNNYAPSYAISPDKKKIVAELKKLAKEAEHVWLATDEDREGEAISWHLVEALGLSEDKTSRIVFHEITKPAIEAAVQNPRKIDHDLVNAQQARRILDRLVGFELSPVLWRKIKPSLSAGRVQSVAVRLIAEREREVNSFETNSYLRVRGIFQTPENKSFTAELNKKFENVEEAEAFLKDCLNAEFKVDSVEVKPAKKSPAPPFTTSTLQQEASRKLGYSVSRTMTLAQKLYESGNITYMRTDSVNLSETALAGAASQIKAEYSSKYHQRRTFKSKNSSAQEAHEAIRPTYFENRFAGKDSGEKRLYELIWKRAIASQMSEALLEKTTAKISTSGRSETFTAQGEVLKFDGFLKVYMEGVDEDDNVLESTKDGEEKMLPPISENMLLNPEDIEAMERFTRPPARYTEATLVKKLEELGIGRPSTYAPTISTIQRREYVIKESRDGKPRDYQVLHLINGNIKKTKESENFGGDKNKLFPSDIGLVVNDFLVEHFDGVMNYNFTADVEKEFDDIAKGLKQWTTMIDKFYKPFHIGVEATMETAERPKGERELGVDPRTGLNVYARMGRYGPYVQLGENKTDEDDKKPQYAGLTKGQLLETITLEDSLELFKLPRTVGEFEGEEMLVNIGRFGPYIRHKNKFTSIGKEDNPMTIESERAVQLILEKRERDANRIIKTFDEAPDVQILNGRWGPFIKIGKKNVKIPKDLEAESLTLEKIREIEAADPKASKTKDKTVKKKPNKKAKAKKVAAKDAAKKAKPKTKAKKK